MALKIISSLFFLLLFHWFCHPEICLLLQHYYWPFHILFSTCFIPPGYFLLSLEISSSGKFSLITSMEYTSPFRSFHFSSHDSYPLNCKFLVYPVTLASCSFRATWATAILSTTVAPEPNTIPAIQKMSDISHWSNCMNIQFLPIWIVHCPCFLAVSLNFISSKSKYNLFYGSLFPSVGTLLEAKTYATQNERQGHILSSLPAVVTRLDIFLQVRWMQVNRCLSCQTPDYKLRERKKVKGE